MERIAGFQKVSLIDWEGMISAVVFLSGCNWNCPFCHNSDLREINKGIDEAELFSYLYKRKGWIDGVVVCGGEPLLEKDVESFTKKIKDTGYKVKIDTNGTNPEVLKKLINNKWVDYIAMDIKTRLTKEKYSIAAAVMCELDKIRESMNVLIKSNVDFEFRTTMVPEIVTNEDIIFNLQFIPRGTKYILQQFLQSNVKNEYFKKISPYSEKELLGLLGEMKQKGVKAWLRS